MVAEAAAEQDETVPVAPKTVAIWFEGTQPFDHVPFMFFVTAANPIQNSFRFFFPDPKTALTYEEAEKKQKAHEPVFREYYDVYVFLTTDRLDRNLFWREYGPLVQITTRGWEQNFSPPSVFEYLFKSIMCGSISALCTRLTSHDTYAMGCQFDYNRIKEQNRVAITLGYVCELHQEEVRSQLGATVLADYQSLVSFKWLGSLVEPGTPAYKMKDNFKYDLKRNSGFKMGFLERAQANVDSIGFDVLKEIMKVVGIIIGAALLLYLNLPKPPAGH